MKKYKCLRTVYEKQTLDEEAIFIHITQATVQYVALTSPSLGNPQFCMNGNSRTHAMQVEELVGKLLRRGTHHIYMGLRDMTLTQ